MLQFMADDVMLHSEPRVHCPTLHLVIADDARYWVEKLQSSFQRYTQEESAFSRTGQCRIQVDPCGSFEAFQRNVTNFIEAGDLVYATIDLCMPRFEGDVPD